jgi:SpoVK/Ycf46/Vps4 family AAA+-type ATPase
MGYYDDDTPKLNNYTAALYEEENEYEIIYYNVSRGLRFLEPHVRLDLVNENAQDIKITLADTHGFCLGKFNFTCQEWAKELLSSYCKEEEEAVKADIIETLQEMIKAIEETPCEDWSYNPEPLPAWLKPQ